MGLCGCRWRAAGPLTGETDRRRSAAGRGRAPPAVNRRLRATGRGLEIYAANKSSTGRRQ
ncbi:hypothetical protein TPA0910_24890 [Streptomyces hygroscopicus subsp. sporocinereus]|uniref:Uncharacterized protein n=1 Tax=Streptomyces hygroscopicus TaxID=1912 RepID=A0ABQ3TYJ4_STRHY|nr:hypothetical protein TPA0910_24890 [Streptomyces hygroscopicus]